MSIQQPLADRMRPETLDQIVGQKHLLSPGQPLYQIIKQHLPISLLLWGPPGCGKSTYAYVLSKTLKMPFEKYNASIQTKAQLQKLIKNHPDDSFVLLLDEIHRLTTPLQDFLLPHVESGHIILVGTTTENPIMAITPALRSRCQIYEFSPVSTDDLKSVILRAAHDFLHVTLDDRTAEAIAQTSNGDVRVAINVLDTLYTMYQDQITFQVVESYAAQQHLIMDKKKTNYYDYLSAFQDSIEGSDTDAALYYLAVILKAGDLDTVVRRLKDSAALDVGLADPEVVNQVINLANTAHEIGLPRASTHVAMATILLCLSPKSDSVLQAYTRASLDADNPTAHPMPTYLRDTHYKHAKELRNAGNMLNMFDQPHQIAKQSYMPHDLIGHHYFYPRENKKDRMYFKRYVTLFEYIYNKKFRPDSRQHIIFDHNFSTDPNKSSGKKPK